LGEVGISVLEVGASTLEGGGYPLVGIVGCACRMVSNKDNLKSDHNAHQTKRGEYEEEGILTIIPVKVFKIRIRSTRTIPKLLLK